MSNIEITLFLGRQKQDGTYVEEIEFKKFLKENLGFHTYTCIASSGLYCFKPEPSTVVIILSEFGEDVLQYQMERFCNLYCDKFDQLEVLVTYKDVKAENYGRLKGSSSGDFELPEFK